jgi:hypothetical protein
VLYDLRLSPLDSHNLVSNKQAFVRECGVAPLFRTLRMFLDDVKIAELCVVTLRNLCSISNPYVSTSSMILFSTHLCAVAVLTVNSG